MPARLDIVIYQGATFTKYLTLSYNTSPITYYDLTNWEPRAQIRRRRRAADVIQKFYFEHLDINSVAWPWDSIDPLAPVKTDGKIIIKMAAKVTAEIPAGETTEDNRSKYVWDFEIENLTTGEVNRILSGDVWINPEVTKF